MADSRLMDVNHTIGALQVAVGCSKTQTYEVRYDESHPDLDGDTRYDHPNLPELPIIFLLNARPEQLLGNDLLVNADAARLPSPESIAINILRECAVSSPFSSSGSGARVDAEPWNLGWYSMAMLQKKWKVLGYFLTRFGFLSQKSLSMYFWGMRYDRLRELLMVFLGALYAPEDPIEHGDEDECGWSFAFPALKYEDKNSGNAYVKRSRDQSKASFSHRIEDPLDMMPPPPPETYTRIPRSTCSFY
ncbi:hypothetical protein AB1N83_013912 [Pleurotus pulmonarius]